MEVGIKQAKNDLSKLVVAAQQGQHVYLMNRGKRIAQIVPVRPPKEASARLMGYGLFKDELNFPDGWNSQEARDRDEAELMRMINRETDA